MYHIVAVKQANDKLIFVKTLFDATKEKIKDFIEQFRYEPRNEYTADLTEIYRILDSSDTNEYVRIITYKNKNQIYVRDNPYTEFVVHFHLFTNTDIVPDFIPDKVSVSDRVECGTATD